MLILVLLLLVDVIPLWLLCVPGVDPSVVSVDPCVAGACVAVGDTILAVNGHYVNMDNIDSVLATLSSCKTLELLLKKGHSHTPHSYSAAASSSSSTALLSPPQTPSHGGLVRLVAGGRGAGGALRPRQFRRPHRHVHLLLYITLDTKEDDPPDEVGPDPQMAPCEI